MTICDYNFILHLFLKIFESVMVLFLKMKKSLKMIKELKPFTNNILEHINKNDESISINNSTIKTKYLS